MTHPLALFLLTLVNLISGFGFFTLASGIMVRARLPRWVRVSGIAYAGFSGLSNCAIAWLALWYPGETLQGVADSITTMVFMGVAALSIWMFLIGTYLEIGRWDDMPSNFEPEKYPSKYDPDQGPDDATA